MQIGTYADDRGNRVDWDGAPIKGTDVIFSGNNNVLRIHSRARLGKLSVQFDCDNGIMVVGASAGVPAFSATVRVRQDSRVFIGENVSMTATAGISATKAPPFQSVRTACWRSECSYAQTTATRSSTWDQASESTSRGISSSAPTCGLATTPSHSARSPSARGAVSGLGSVVTKDVPNNAVAAGNPARVVRTNIAWAWPHLSLVRPYYKPDASTIKKTRWWARMGEQPSQCEDAAPRSRRRRILTVSAKRLPKGL